MINWMVVAGPRLVLEQHPVDQHYDDHALVGIEPRERLEAQPEILVRPALLAIEKQHIRAHGQRDGDPAQYVQGRLLSELKELARDLGRQEGAKTVVVKGGTRTTGANPGKVPRDITIKLSTEFLKIKR